MISELESAKKDLAFLTETIDSERDVLLLLRSSLELSLIKLGHEQDIVSEAVDEFYNKRALH